MASILLVDDNAVERRHLAGILAGAGYVVVEAANAAEALAAVRVCVPDAVVCDIHGSERDSLDLVASLRAEVPGVPVLVTAIFVR